MENSQNNENTNNLDIAYKVFAKNTVYSILNTYGLFILSIVTSFLLARMISKEEWGILILANSIILILVILSNFIPPGLIFAMSFYIPRYRAKNNITKLRSFILKALYLRIFSAVIFFSIGLIIFAIFSNFFGNYLENHLNLVYILLPLIIISSIDSFIVTTLIGFNLFKFNLVFHSIKSITNIIPLLWYFFTIKTIEIEIVAFINLITALFPLIFGMVILFIKFPKRISKSEEGISFKHLIKKVVKYGSFLRVQGIMGEIWTQSQTQAIGVYVNSEWVTGNSISKNYTTISGMFLNSLNGSLLYSFSSVDYKKNYDKLIRLYKSILYYTIFIFLIITGILFLFSDFFLGLVFGEDYIVFSILIKLSLIANAVSIYGSLYLILLRTTYRIKQQIYLFVFGYPIQIIVFLVGIINFGIIGELYIEIIYRIILVILIYIASIKTMKLDVSFKKIIILYFTFFFSIFLSLGLGELIFNEINFQFWQNVNLPIFTHLNLLNILVFLILFLSLNIFFKTITKSDIESIELLFAKDTISNKYIKKFLRLLKRFLR